MARQRLRSLLLGSFTHSSLPAKRRRRPAACEVSLLDFATAKAEVRLEAIIHQTVALPGKAGCGSADAPFMPPAAVPT